MIRYAKPDRTAGWYDVMEDETTPAYTIDGNVITIILCEQMLTVPGNVFVELNFYTSTERLSTFSFLLKVEKSVLSDNEIISSDYFNVLSNKIEALLGATTHPPQIDSTTKNWLLWSEDHNQYEDSGYSSVGERGPAGVITVTSSVKYQTSSSGTTPPSGTWLDNIPSVTQGQYLWSRTVLTFGDGTTATSYQPIYKAIDGQGAPGTSVPLRDGGGGAVGTSTSFSRDDHQHPLNANSTAPEDLGTASAGTSDYYSHDDHVHNTPIVHLTGTLSNLPTTISDSKIKSDMVLVNVTFGTPGVLVSDLGWSTSNGSITFSGTLLTSQTTTIAFDLATVR